MRFFGWLLGRVLLVLAGIAGLMWLFAPRIGLDPAQVAARSAQSVSAVPDSIDLDGWLEEREAAVVALRPGAEKRVVWAGDMGARTDLAVVYIHGFSAAAEEIRPVPDRVAQALGANLFFTRLNGHGRDGAAMAEAQAEDWMSDLAEALEVGRRLGDRVLVLTTSTGGTLMALAAQTSHAQDVAGVVFVSPNFQVNNPAAVLLEWPGAEWWMPALVGQVRSFRPHNAGQAAHWTTSYPSAAVFPMATVVKAARDLDYPAMTVPALFLISESDRVVDPTVSADIAARWGGGARLVVLELGADDDPFGHVIAGDIMSPGQTDRAVAEIVEWFEAIR